jgi:hypothetical protein
LDAWSKSCQEAGTKIGRPWNNVPKIGGWMEELGFEDVVEKIFEVPTNTWARGRKAKELGMWLNADVTGGLSASRPLLMKVLEWSPEKTDLVLADARNDLQNKGIHAYMPM